MMNQMTESAAVRMPLRRKVRGSLLCLAMTFVLSTAAQATTFRFESDPFAGTNILTTPGRQVLGGESFVNFAVPTDVFSLESNAFGVAGPVNFVNNVASSLPTGGVNVIVLRSFDDDANSLTPFGAGNAANLIANQVTTPGAGFFIYFNQALDLPRLVFSTDLNDNTADLKIVARILNLTGQSGRDALAGFTAANFEITTTAPEPASFFLVGAVGILAGCRYLVRRRCNA